MAWPKTITDERDYTQPYTATIRRGQIQTLERLRDETGRPASWFVREALDRYLAQLEGIEHDDRDAPHR